MVSEEATAYLDELTWKQRRIAGRILRPHIVPAAGLRQFDRNDYDRNKEDKGGLARAWVPQRVWNRDQDILNAPTPGQEVGLKWAIKEVQDKLYVVEEINRAFMNQAEVFPVQHGVGITLNFLAVCFKRYRKDIDEVCDFTQGHLDTFVKESYMRNALDEAIIRKRRAWHHMLKIKRRLNPPGSHGGPLANVALVVCTATVCAAYVTCCVLKWLQHCSHPHVPELLDIAGHFLLVIQIPPMILLSTMVFAPLIEDCRRSNAARLASARVTEHREEREETSIEEDDQFLSATLDDDEAADIQRLRETRSKIEGGTILSGPMSEDSSSAGPAERHGKKLGI
jgi:hypothetical protein